MQPFRTVPARASGRISGSGVLEAAGRVSGLRLKRPGTRWPERGANAMLALEGWVMNQRLADPPDWQANESGRRGMTGILGYTPTTPGGLHPAPACAIWARQDGPKHHESVGMVGGVAFTLPP